ncbi:winged helix-turn-helix domain-containing protein [Streptomyces sp. Ag109_G2-15]|uniref:helix-turn-helix domain-containing protein n=1 Tax=Streptomyces sp. Ag109_G2-15 TaxID=1938850 RepID=UPI00359C379C
MAAAGRGRFCRRARRAGRSSARTKSPGWKVNWSAGRSPTAGRTQRWTLARIKTLIGRLFHVSYTVEGRWQLLKRHGTFFPPVPGRFRFRGAPRPSRRRTPGGRRGGGWGRA